jgi:GR25 family glycosyltransferase involved in LPS biosynthesis
MENKIHVEVINLQRSKDRWQAIQKWNHGFTDFNRFDAIDASQLQYVDDLRISLKTKLYIKANAKRSFQDINSIGAIGCSLSWETILRNFYNTKGKDYLLVLEDDIDLSLYMNTGKTFAETLYEEIEKLPSEDWDLFLLGGSRSTLGFSVGKDYIPWEANKTSTFDVSSTLTNPYSFNMEGVSEYVRVKQFLGTHAILIKREAIPKLLKEFFPIEIHIDSYISFLAQKGDIKIIHKPSFSLYQNSSWEGTIGHESNSISLLNQSDHWYKIFFFVLLIILLFYIIYYFIRYKVYIYCRNITCGTVLSSG